MTCEQKSLPLKLASPTPDYVRKLAHGETKKPSGNHPYWEAIMELHLKGWRPMEIWTWMLERNIWVTPAQIAMVLLTKPRLTKFPEAKRPSAPGTNNNTGQVNTHKP